MFKLGRLLCQKQPRLSEIENDKNSKQEQGVQYSDTFFQQNGDDKTKKLSQIHDIVLTDPKDSITTPIVQEEPIEEIDEQDQIVQENDTLNYAKRKEESKESIAKSKIYYSDDACNMDTCSKRECSSNTCNRIIDKKKVADKDIDPSKLTELINSSIKEAMQTIIKQCAMDKNGVTSPEKKPSQERPKTQILDKSICRNKQDVTTAIKKHDDDEKYISKKRYHPCDYTRKYEKESNAVNAIKKCVKKSHDGSTVSKYRPIKEKEKGMKKHSKASKNLKTDNRRMTGNVNIYICSEANENAQRKEKQKEKSESCTESSSETTTERTNSTCVRTSSVSSSKLVSSIQKRRQKLQEQESENYFHKRENRVTRSNDIDGVCYEKYENDSSMTLKQDDRLEISTLSSRSTEIGSIVSSVSSTRDGCCCQDTVSSYVEMHRQDFMRLKPKFMSYDEKEDQQLCTTRIFPKHWTRDEIGDSWMKRSVCVSKTHLRRRDSINNSIDQRRSDCRNTCRYCCKDKVDCKYNRAIKRRSSFDILHDKGLHRKWSKCSCIVEEDEEEQCTSVPLKEETIEEKLTICKNKFDKSMKENLEEPTIRKNLNNSNENFNKNEDTLESINQPKKSLGSIETSKVTETDEDTLEKKTENLKESSTVSRTLVLEKKLKKQDSPVVLKSQQPNKDTENVSSLLSEVPAKRNVKETFEVKEQKERKSEEKSKNSFLGRSIKKAMGLVRQTKTNRSKSPNNNVKNVQAMNDQKMNSPTILNSTRNNKFGTEAASKIGVPVVPIVQNNHNTSLSLKQAKVKLNTTKLTNNENIQKTDSNKRPKSKLQTILASRKTLQPVKQATTNLKTSKLPEDTNVAENTQDTKEEIDLSKDEGATGDSEKVSTDKATPCIKIKFEENPRQEESAEADSYPCEKKSSDSAVNCCCCCRLPVIDCTCDVKETSTVSIVPKPVSEDVCTSNFECYRAVDNCKCNEPVVYENYCNSGNTCRYDVPCIDRSKPQEKCHCRPTYVDCYTTNYQHTCIEDIICLYCKHPRDKCVCRAPISKCSYCGLSFDICKCREQVKICNGRRIVTDHDGDHKICVTAWKPKPEVRRYFSRNFNDFPSDSVEDCYCRKPYKNYGFNDLPYQRSSAFSDVMSELQQKISDSVCCERCRKSPCCCRRDVNESVDVEDRKGRCYIGSKQRHRSRSPEIDRSYRKSPINHRFPPDKNSQRRTSSPLSRICYSCKASPCRCKRGGRSTTKRPPRAKCYYCKSSPCTCISTREVNKSRSCKCGDSPCRSKEKETVLRGKAFDDARKKNVEKVFRTGESNTCVCPLTKPY